MGSHHIVKLQRPHPSWRVYAKNYIDPDCSFKYRFHWEYAKDEEEAKKLAEKLIKHCQAVHVYSPHYRRPGTFWVLEKKGWKSVTETDRTNQKKKEGDSND